MGIRDKMEDDYDYTLTCSCQWVADCEPGERGGLRVLEVQDSDGSM